MWHLRTLSPLFPLALALWCVVAGSACPEVTLEPLRATATASPARLDLGEVYVDSTSQAVVTLLSTGNAPLQVRQVTLSGSERFSVDQQSATLLPGEALEIAVRFQPRAAGRQAATLSIETSAEPRPLLVVEVVGAGVESPPCDDDNPCTDDSFDPAAERCAHAVRTGACDDHSACTVDDACAQGVCRGRAISCDDGLDCTRDLCDSATGCTAVVDPALCDDGDPCTEASCGADGTCRNTTVVDGTACGPIDGCATMPTCRAGACTLLPVLDGTPCDDGDRCTADDRCLDGICQGRFAPRPPEAVAQLHSFGTGLSKGVILSHRTLLFAEPRGGSFGELGEFTPGDRTTISTIDYSDMTLNLVGQVVVAVHGVSALARLDDQSAILLPQDARALPRGQQAGPRLRAISAVVGQDPVVRGAVILPAAARLDEGAVFAAHQRTLYLFTRSTSTLYTVDATDLDAPAVTSAVILPRDATSMAVDPANQRLLVAGPDLGLRAFTLAAPRTPALEEIVVVEPEALPTGLPSNHVESVRVQGELVLVHTRDRGLENNRLEIRAAHDLSHLSMVELTEDAYHFNHWVNDFGLWIVYEVSGWATLELFDLTDPLHPRLSRRDSVWWALQGIDLDALQVRGFTLLIDRGPRGPGAPTWGGGYQLAKLAGDASGFSFARIGARGLGQLHTLVTTDGELSALSPGAAHSILIFPSGAAQWQSSGVFDEEANLFSIPHQGGSASTYAVFPGYGSRFWSNDGPYDFLLARWVEIGYHSSPPELGLVVAPGYHRSMQSDGRFLFGLVDHHEETGSAWSLQVYDLHALEAGAEVPLEPSVSVPFGAETAHLEPTSVGLSEDHSSLAVSGVLQGEGAERRDALAVIDLGGMLPPAEESGGQAFPEWLGTTDQVILDVAMAGATVATLERRPARESPCCLSDTLRVYDVAAGVREHTLAPRQSLPLEEGIHFLSLRGSTAYVGTPRGIAVVDLESADGPRLVSEIETPHPPTSAVWINDQLYVASYSTLTTVAGECVAP